MAKFTFEDAANGNVPEAQLTVYDGNREPLVLGAQQQLGRAGAGGSVYEIPKAPDFCVKLFKPQDLANPTKRKHILSGLEAMLEMPECARDSRLAWPLGRIYGKDGGVIGYMMRRIPNGFKPFKMVFGGPVSVKRKFPTIRRKELALAAKNFVDLLVFLESVGVRPADFNPDNFFLDFNDGCRVLAIDTDSFMFYERNGKVHASDMYFPDYAPPEILRDPKFAKRERTVEQTRFSAAVLAFMLLMTGQHPYSFVEALDGSTTGNPVENILAGKCPLGSGAGCKQAPEWYAMWSWLTSGLQAAFIATFRDGHSNPSARTTLEDLAHELDGFIYVCDRAPERNELAPKVPKMPTPRNPNGPDRYSAPVGNPYPRPRAPAGYAARPQIQHPYTAGQYAPRPYGPRPYSRGNRPQPPPFWWLSPVWWWPVLK